MKKQLLYSLLSFIILFSSCNQDENEELFSSKLVSTWEIANWDESINREVVISFIFRTDGTYTYQWTQRVSNEDDNEGYQLMINGFFSSVGGELSLMPKEIFHAPMPNNGPPHGPKEELVRSDFSGTQVDKMQFKISEDGQELLIYATHPQGSDTVYNKVN